jgi:hypothetical protein
MDDQVENADAYVDEEDPGTDAADDDSNVAEEDRSHATGTTAHDDDDDDEIKSTTVGDDASSQLSTPVPPPKKKRRKPNIPASARKGRAPAVAGLTIPFRTVKKVCRSKIRWYLREETDVFVRSKSLL